MAWGARQHEDGTWRICERKGRTILSAAGSELAFAGRAACERCTKELNDLWWDHYLAARKAKQIEPDIYAGIMDVLNKHGGLSAR